MSKFVLVNAWVRINGVDLSEYISEVHVNREADQVEVTGMGSTARSFLQGLKAESFEFVAFQDFASAKVHATLGPLYASGSPFLVEVAANGSSLSATNPKFSGSCVLFTENPLDGAVGDASTTPITCVLSGGTISEGTA